MAQWIKPDININFIGRARTMITVSLVVIGIGIGGMVVNYFVRGDALNWSIDFKGGTQMQIIFQKKVDPGNIRGAMSKGGFKGIEVVEITKSTCPKYKVDLTAALPSDDKKLIEARGNVRETFKNDMLFRAGLEKGKKNLEIEFLDQIEDDKLKAGLTSAGLQVAKVTKVTDGFCPRFMVRLSEVSAFNKLKQETVEKALKADGLKKFDHKPGSDRVELTYVDKKKINKEKIKSAFSSVGMKVFQVETKGKVVKVNMSGLEQNVRTALDTNLGKDSIKGIPQVETVGAKMGKQLRDNGIQAVLWSLLLMLVYIAFRFDFRYAPGAVVSLAHDVVITTGIFALTWQDFSLTVIAALLTIAGYSVNDTIVIYDRIRENVARLRDRKFDRVVNASINETLSRTLLTSLTTLFTCVSIWVVGTGVLRTFAFALTLGVIVGTYSTVFIASPLVVTLNEKFAKKSR